MKPKPLLLQRIKAKQNRRLELKLRERLGRLRRSFERPPKHLIDLEEDYENNKL